MMNQSDSIQSQFAAVASVYDRQRRELIPCFDDFYTIPIALSHQVNNVQRILDLGAGTGQ